MPVSQSDCNAIRFVLDGEVRVVAGIDSNMTVLNYLRDELRKTGTKEGCAEGDCGACTVVLAELDGNRVRYRAINSCIQFVPTLDGKELITVENLKGPDGSLHPVQQAMVDCHASQCGFCTPGFVMSLFALYKSEDKPSRRRIDDALAGNLCRCTGYRPIIEAAEAMHRIGNELSDQDAHWMNCSFSSSPDSRTGGEREAYERLRSIQRRDTLRFATSGFAGSKRHYFAPTSVVDCASLIAQHPDAHILAGGTDVGLWVTKNHKDLETIIYTGNVKELRRLELSDTHIEVGAAVTLNEVHELIGQHYPSLAELLRRFASPPIRNAATLVGNIANGSPIGDSMPALISLGASLLLRQGQQTREVMLEEYFLSYQRTVLNAGELVERVRIPLHHEPHSFRTYKVSKRFDQDISAVCAAFFLQREKHRVIKIRACYGGVAEIPKRAPACEQALSGTEWNDESVCVAMSALDEDFTPISDMRASKDYRRLVAKNLLRRFWLDTDPTSIQTSVIDYLP